MKARKAIKIVFLSVFSLMIMTGFGHADLNQGLVAYYPFHGNANDESGYNNHGTVHGAILAADRFGQSNTAYYFDGYNDYIEVPYSVLNHPSYITVACWFKILQKPTKMPDILSTHQFGGYGFELNGKENFLYWIVDTGSGYQKVGIPLNDFILDTWHFIAGTYDGYRLRVYLNGNLKAEKLVTGHVTYDYRNSLLFGVDAGEGSSPDPSAGTFGYFGGYLDQVWLYNRALSSAEISDLYSFVDYFNLSINRNPVTGGRVIGLGIDCGNDCHELYPKNTSVQLTAVPNENYAFFSWNDGFTTNKLNPITITMNSDKVIKASFYNTEAKDLIYPVFGLSNNNPNPSNNKKDPLIDGWMGRGVGKKSAKEGHLGQDYYLEDNSPGKPVYAIANGEIVEVLNGPGRFGWCDRLDHGWGPVVVVKHNNSEGFKVSDSAVVDPTGCGTDLNPKVVYSLYGHLSKLSIQKLKVGDLVRKGQQIGNIGEFGIDQISWPTNHLHFELKDEKGYQEGIWYINNPGICPVEGAYYCKDRIIKGVGTGYSKLKGFAPHRYVPSVFICDNIIGKPSVSITGIESDASETPGHFGRFTVARSCPAGEELLVSYVIGGTATNGKDYRLLPGTVVIPAGQSSANVIVRPIDDSIVEGSETVMIQLLDDPLYTVISPNSATVTITDNDG